MGIEVAENSKEIRVEQANMLNTKISIWTQWIRYLETKEKAAVFYKSGAKKYSECFYINVYLSPTVQIEISVCLTCWLV